jgi:hypothetical protein
MKLTKTPDDFANSLWVIIPILIGLFLFIFGEFKEAFPAEIPEETAIICIIGEAANQGDKGMLALAEALRNRGTTKGVYGCQSNLHARQPKRVHQQALNAWRKSATSNITDGATHWENIKAFGKPYWVDSMERVYEYKDHVFYKKRRLI